MRNVKFIGCVVVAIFACVSMDACTVSGEAVEMESQDGTFGAADGGSSNAPSKDVEKDTSSSSLDTLETSSGYFVTAAALNSIFKDYTEDLEFVRIPAMALSRGSVKNTVDTFFVATKEVTQGLYEKVMGSLHKQDKQNAKFPVVNVNWYDAVLFCNKLSKKMKLDTAYSYTTVGKDNYLEKLEIDYSVHALRLATETEWEIAAHGGTTSKYYWGDDVASKYAFYGQSKGPQEVGALLPNGYDLYDMAGNVSEWVNDWYASYSTVDAKNPVGPEKGTSRCIRGGGWADKVTSITPKERDSKDPLYRGYTLGFRIVYSNGI